MTRGRRVMGVALFVAVAALGALATRGDAQEPPTITLPEVSTTTSTTITPGGGGPSTTPTSQPGSPGDPGAPTTTADPGQDGDNGSPTGGGPGQTIPPDAQAVIDSIVRTGGMDNHLLVAGERALLAAGVDPDQAARLAYGPFPVAGPTAWVDDCGIL